MRGKGSESEIKRLREGRVRLCKGQKRALAREAGIPGNEGKHITYASLMRKTLLKGYWMN